MASLNKVTRCTAAGVQGERVGMCAGSVVFDPRVILHTALAGSHGSIRGNHVWDNAVNIRHDVVMCDILKTCDV